MTLQNRFPCQCGHPYEDHSDVNGQPAGGQSMCFFIKKNSMVVDCMCMKYKSDNLEFMKQQYEKEKD